MLFPVLEKQTMSSMNSFTRSRPSQTRNMMDWKQVFVASLDSHSPSCVHTAVVGIMKFLSMVHWEKITDQVRRAE